MRKRWPKRSQAIVLSLAVAGVFAGSVLGARIGEPSPEAFQSPVHDGALVRVAPLSAENGMSARGLFLQRTTDGLLCLWDAPDGTSRARQGGCNSASDPLLGQSLIVSFAYEGGPAAGDVSDARLIGLAAENVDEVSILMSNGSRLRLPLRRVPTNMGSFRAFGRRFARGPLNHGITPVAVVALDESGKEIERQPTGFQG
jgi:hypothetical protein